MNKPMPLLPFDYNLTRSKRKTLAIYVKSGKVDVRAPMRAPKGWIEAFIHEKSSWIQKQIQQQKQQDKEKLVIADNRVISFFGKPRKIQVIPCPTQKVQLTRELLLIFTRQHTPERIETLFNQWLMDQAREYMATQSIKYARTLGVKTRLKDVVFKKTKSKWGHCCSDGVIQYNWLVMMAPKPVVNYLIAHETSHLLHMNHSENFWRTVARLCPDYREYRDWLRNNGHRLWF